MARLNQIIAVANGKKKQCEKALTEVYHKLQKSPLFEGIARTYRPKDEDGDKLPPESKHVQYNVVDAIDEATLAMSDMFDVIFAQEVANRFAFADIIVDGKIIAKDVPVTYMLFLEKQLLNIQAFIEKLPVLDPGHEWAFNAATNCYGSKAVETTRTKKIPRNHVLAAATDKHPAQVQVYNEDVVAGYWTTIIYSGAMMESEKRTMLDRVRKLQEAVKFAREQANSIEIEQRPIAENVFGYLFA